MWGFLETLAYPASPNQTSPKAVLVMSVLQERLFVGGSLSPVARASPLSNASLFPQVAQSNGSLFGQPWCSQRILDGLTVYYFPL